MDNISLLCYSIINEGIKRDEPFINLKLSNKGLEVLDFFFEELSDTLKISVEDAGEVLYKFTSLCNGNGSLDVSSKGSTYMVTPKVIEGDKDVDMVVAIWKL